MVRPGRFSPRFTRRAVVGGLSAALLSGAAPRRTWNSTNADVIVIGAGLAGLHAASLIEQAGYKVIILEGSERIGGRLHTLDDLPGNPDAGGIQVGASYARFHAIADRLGVERYVPPPGGRGALYHIGGQSLGAAEWPGAAVNQLAPGEKNLPPDRLFFSYLSGLPKLEKITDWMTPDSQRHDQSLRQFLTGAGASKEAQRLIEANLNGNGLDQQSALHMIRSLAIFRAGSKAGATSYVRGGSARMTDAMAAALKSEIITDSPVAALEDEVDGIEISLSGRNRLGHRKYGARHVICTMPFSALRSVKIEAPLPPYFRALIDHLPYTYASFAYVSASEPFWRGDGLPETIWSDHPLLGRVFVLGDDPAMLKVWLNGPSALALDRMDRADARAAILRNIEAARPSARGKIKVERLFNWQQNPFARGIYHHIGTGQGQALAAATQYRAARLHFAGEHLAQASSGMEGALESGERVARQLLEIL